MKKAGQIIYAIPFLVFGLLHFMNAGKMSGMIPDFLPGGEFWVYLTGLAMLLAGVATLAGKWVYQAGLGLAIMLLIFILTIHLPGVMNQETMEASMPNLLKDMALMGGALMLAAQHKPAE